MAYKFPWDLFLDLVSLGIWFSSQASSQLQNQPLWENQQISSLQSAAGTDLFSQDVCLSANPLDLSWGRFGPELRQEAKNLRMTMLRCQVIRSCSIAHGGLGIGASVNQKANHFNITPFCRNMQGCCPTKLSCHLLAGTNFKQMTDDL